MPRESFESRKERGLKIYAKLAKMYPDAHCALDFTNAFELLVATTLSAQCTDARVNIVMKTFHPTFPTVKSVAEAELSEIEEVIRSTGFYHQKAKSLKSMATDLMEKFGGKVPKSMEELITLRGVGRKTASVVLWNAFGINEGIAVDTHVMRVAGKMLKLTYETEQAKIEQDLMELYPRKNWGMITHYIISHGRAICIANRPKCEACGINSLCPSSKV
jgi:endonuclease-3